MSHQFSTPVTNSGSLSDMQLDHGATRKKRKGSFCVHRDQVNHNDLLSQIHLKNRAIQQLQMSHQSQLGRNMELQSDVGRLEKKIRELTTSENQDTDMFLPMDNDHLHLDYRIFDERERAKEVKKPFELRHHLLPGFPNMGLMEGFADCANQSTCEIGVICARILGCEIPPQGDNFGCNLNQIPNALD